MIYDIICNDFPQKCGLAAGFLTIFLWGGGNDSYRYRISAVATCLYNGTVGSAPPTKTPVAAAD
ncbi:MAG: hypothetical protein ACOC9V_06335 [Chloroflexota bacterium]